MTHKAAANLEKYSRWKLVSRGCWRWVEGFVSDSNFKLKFRHMSLVASKTKRDWKVADKKSSCFMVEKRKFLLTDWRDNSPTASGSWVEKSYGLWWSDYRKLCTQTNSFFMLFYSAREKEENKLDIRWRIVCHCRRFCCCRRRLGCAQSILTALKTTSALFSLALPFMLAA